MRVTVLEHFSTLLRGEAPAALVREGSALVHAVAADLAALPGVEPLLIEPGGNRQRALRAALRHSEAALIIAPESDGVLHRLTSMVARTGRLLLGSGPEAVRLAADKIATSRCLISGGVPTPASTPVPTEPSKALALLSAHPRPYVLKPRDGCGCRGVRVVRQRFEVEEALARSARWAGATGLLVQGFLDGDAASVSLIVGRSDVGGGGKGLLSLGLNRQSVHGRTALRYGGGVTPWRDARAGEAECRAIQAIEVLRRKCPDLSGYVGVDLVLGLRGAQVVDINPRLTTSYIGLRRLAGPRLARLMLDAAIGLPLPQAVTLQGVCRFDASGAVRVTRPAPGIGEPARAMVGAA